MVHLIGLLGKKGSGKDTLALKLKEQNYLQYAFADPLKKGIQIFFDLTDNQLHDEKLKEIIDDRWGVSPRNLFQIIGTEIFQHEINNHLDLKISPKYHWTYLFEQWYQKQLIENPNIKVIISDVRFPHEIETIKKLGGKIIKVTRPEKDNNLDEHSSETFIDQIPNTDIDYLIKNDGTLNDLYTKLNKSIQEIN